MLGRECPFFFCKSKIVVYLLLGICFFFCQEGVAKNLPPLWPDDVNEEITKILTTVFNKLHCFNSIINIWLRTWWLFSYLETWGLRASRVGGCKGPWTLFRGAVQDLVRHWEGSLDEPLPAAVNHSLRWQSNLSHSVRVTAIPQDASMFQMISFINSKWENKKNLLQKLKTPCIFLKLLKHVLYPSEINNISFRYQLPIAGSVFILWLLRFLRGVLCVPAGNCGWACVGVPSSKLGDICGEYSNILF